MKDIEYIEKFLIMRVEHAERRASDIRESHGDKPNETHNYHGGRSLGMWEGMAHAYQNILDRIKTTRETN